eukprot:6474617-Amphidinium_carterae.1
MLSAWDCVASGPARRVWSKLVCRGVEVVLGMTHDESRTKTLFGFAKDTGGSARVSQHVQEFGRGWSRPLRQM